MFFFNILNRRKIPRLKKKKLFRGKSAAPRKNIDDTSTWSYNFYLDCSERSCIGAFECKLCNCCVSVISLVLCILIFVDRNRPRDLSLNLPNNWEPFFWSIEKSNITETVSFSICRDVLKLDISDRDQSVAIFQWLVLAIGNVVQSFENWYSTWMNWW